MCCRAGQSYCESPQAPARTMRRDCRASDALGASIRSARVRASAEKNLAEKLAELTCIRAIISHEVLKSRPNPWFTSGSQTSGTEQQRSTPSQALRCDHSTNRNARA